MERAIKVDPAAANNPMNRPALYIVGETFAGLKRLPASGLFITNASPILPKPIVIPTVIRTIPRIRRNTGAASNFAGLVKDLADSALCLELAAFKGIATLGALPQARLRSLADRQEPELYLLKPF
jgi:hypothetical protein